MKFLSGALAVLIAATQASAATVSFSAFNVDGFDTGSYDKALYYANGSMYVGGIQAKPYAEKLICNSHFSECRFFLPRKLTCKSHCVGPILQLYLHVLQDHTDLGQHNPLIHLVVF